MCIKNPTQEDGEDTFVQRFAGKTKGVISGFDRIVFKGCLRPLMFADGAMAFLRSRGVLNKDYKTWVMAQSEALVATANEYARSTCGRGISSPNYILCSTPF